MDSCKLSHSPDAHEILPDACVCLYLSVVVVVGCRRAVCLCEVGWECACVYLQDDNTLTGGSSENTHGSSNGPITHTCSQRSNDPPPWRAHPGYLCRGGALITAT